MFEFGVEFDSIKGRRLLILPPRDWRHARQLKILPCLRINRRNNDLLGKTMLPFWGIIFVGSKTLGEKQSFSRWQKRVMQLYKVFKKGLAGENTCFFFNASSSLFLEALNQRWSSQMCCFSDLANYALKQLDGMGWMCDIVMAWFSIEKYVDRPNRHLWNILKASYPRDPCDDCIFTYMNGWFSWFACR